MDFINKLGLYAEYFNFFIQNYLIWAIILIVAFFYYSQISESLLFRSIKSEEIRYLRLHCNCCNIISTHI